MTLFLCCPIILKDPKYLLAIKTAQSRLTNVGYAVINPLDSYRTMKPLAALKAITAAVAYCDAVAVYQGYRSSDVCQFILAIAQKLHLPLKGVNLWERYHQPVLDNWQEL